MKRYLCPICDRELRAGSYCPDCRKIVRNPIVYEGVLPNEDTGNYLLNHEKVHPGKQCVLPNEERNCRTPQEIREERQFQQMAGSTGTRAERQFQQAARQTGTREERQFQRAGKPNGIWETAIGSAGKTRGQKQAGCVVWIVVLWVIISVIVNVLSQLVG